MINEHTFFSVRMFCIIMPCPLTLLRLLFPREGGVSYREHPSYEIWLFLVLRTFHVFVWNILADVLTLQLHTSGMYMWFSLNLYTETVDLSSLIPSCKNNGDASVPL